MKELVIRKCKKCNAMVKVLEDCNCPSCGIICCDEKMSLVKANDTDASFEKHVPTYEIKKDKIIVKVNHVMEDDHYIEWISSVTENEEHTKYLKPGMKAEAEFEYVKGMTLYSYCNKHSLWKVEVE